MSSGSRRTLSSSFLAATTIICCFRRPSATAAANAATARAPHSTVPSTPLSLRPRSREFSFVVTPHNRRMVHTRRSARQAGQEQQKRIRRHLRHGYGSQQRSASTSTFSAARNPASDNDDNYLSVQLGAPSSSPQPPPVAASMTSARNATTSATTTATKTKTSTETVAAPGNNKRRKKAATTTTTRQPATATAASAVLVSPVQAPSSSSSKAADGTNRRTLLFDLGQDFTDGDGLVEATLVRRPSFRNRSPYVADVLLSEADGGREALAHVPNLGMGGKCVPGARLLLKYARNSRTHEKIGPNAKNPKYGTPKCEFIAQLLCDSKMQTWVGAHPSLGERIARVWLERNLVVGIPPVRDLQAQVRNPCGIDGFRADFLVTHTDGTKRIVEVKTVVDVVGGDGQSGSSGTGTGSERCRSGTTAVFPVGSRSNQVYEGQKVVSSRAIKHVNELARIASGEVAGGDADQGHELYSATLLFVVIRGDAVALNPTATCPGFASALMKAHRDAGVQVLAKRVLWGTGTGTDERSNENKIGACYDDGSSTMLPIEWSANTA